MPAVASRSHGGVSILGHLLVESSSWVMLQGCGATKITLRAGTWAHHGVCDLH